MPLTKMSLNSFLIFFLLVLAFSSCSEEEELLSAQNLELNASNGSALNRDGNSGDGPSNERNRPRNQSEREASQTILSWNELFLELDQYATGMRPNATARALAYIHLSAYEAALPRMRDYRSNTSHLDGLLIDHEEAGRDLNIAIALNSTYASVIDHFLLHLPEHMRDEIGALEENNLTSLSEELSNDELESAISWGKYVATQVISYSQTDQAAEEQILSPQPASYTPPTGEGYWTFSAEEERALFPYWGTVRTFIITPSETSTVPPLPYSTAPESEYYQQMLAVSDANDLAKTSDEEQLWIAEFWSDDVETLMFSPPTRQVSIAQQLINQRELRFDEALYLLLKVGFSLNDAAVSTWQDKYEYMVMRPSVYIQEHIDASFQTNLYRLIPWPNPTFPSYPSGHSTFASAAAGVFIDFFGNRANFIDRSHEDRTEFRGAPRRFRSFEDMARENAFSRIPLGVHMEMDCTEGLRLGYEISDAVNQLRLRRRGA